MGVNGTTWKGMCSECSHCYSVAGELKLCLHYNSTCQQVARNCIAFSAREKGAAK